MRMMLILPLTPSHALRTELGGFPIHTVRALHTLSFIEHWG